jgi:hypothetical protein
MVSASNPLALRPEGRSAWLPFSPDYGRVGPSYFLRARNCEFCVGQRGTAGIHVSLHKDGEGHLTAPEHETAEEWGFPSEWDTLAQFHPGLESTASCCASGTRTEVFQRSGPRGRQNPDPFVRRLTGTQMTGASNCT